MLRKKDTSAGFHPSIPLGAEIKAPNRHVLRHDGALDQATLSPAIHLVMLSMARLRNSVSTLQFENVDVALSDARRAIEKGDGRSPRDRHVIRFATEYATIHHTPDENLPPMSVEMVLDMHRRLMVEMVPDDALGILKTKPNGIIDQTTGQFIFEATPPERTLAELEALFSWFSEARDELPEVAVAGTLLAEFECIHPFHDGNGRIGRMLNILALRHLGLRNVALVPLDGRFFHTREKYYEKIASTNDGTTWFVWNRYFARELDKAYKIATRRGDLKSLLENQPPSTQELLAWILSGDTNWFRHADYPNPKKHSPATISKALRALAEEGIVESRGEKKGRAYRLTTEFISRLYSGEFLD